MKLLPHADAVLVVYSTVDRQTFHHANDVLYALRKASGREEVCVLIANKTDLVRLRQIAEMGKITVEWPSFLMACHLLVYFP